MSSANLRNLLIEFQATVNGEATIAALNLDHIEARAPDRHHAREVPRVSFIRPDDRPQREIHRREEAADRRTAVTNTARIVFPSHPRRQPPSRTASLAGPSQLRGGGICRICGCTDDNACVVDGIACHWIEPDLCSACVSEEGQSDG